MTAPNKPLKILYLVTEDWYFCSHRLPLAVAARQAGYAVTVVTRVRQHGDAITSAGIKLIPLPWSRGERSPLKVLRALWLIYRILRDEQPDLLHNVALKPVLYGSLVAPFAGVRRVVNALAGLGLLYSSKQSRFRRLRVALQPILRGLLSRPRTRVIVQNPDDFDTLVRHAIIPVCRGVLIRGAGVDIETFVPTPEPAGTVVVMLAARMLWSKGVGTFVEAAGILRGKGHKARWVLVGDSDEDNPDAVSSTLLADWDAAGVVEWWRHRADMPDVLSQSHIVCLPSSYGEGVPKILLEAAAAGRPIVTTDWPGCREVVIHGQNGLLVPPGDAVALAEALAELLGNPDLRLRMGERGRQIAIEEFASDRIVQETLAVYSDLFADAVDAA